MTFDRAHVTFADGFEIDMPLTAGPAGDRTWEQTAAAACAYAEQNAGKAYKTVDVVSVRIREDSGGQD